jgi:DNA-binding transcriptional regulator YiaG
VDVPRLNVPRCEACGELYFDNWADDQIRLALRDQLHLLRPSQLRANREALGLSRHELATRLGVEEAALERWEEEPAALPPRVADNLLRVYFALPPVRSVLGTTPHPELGACVSTSGITALSD